MWIFILTMVEVRISASFERRKCFRASPCPAPACLLFFSGPLGSITGQGASAVVGGKPCHPSSLRGVETHMLYRPMPGVGGYRIGELPLGPEGRSNVETDKMTSRLSFARLSCALLRRCASGRVSKKKRYIQDTFTTQKFLFMYTSGDANGFRLLTRIMSPT